MAIPAAAAFQVMVTGDDANGGGFVPGGAGVDRSQDDTAFASGVNLTVDAATNTDVAPDGYTPDVADTNNIIQITGGAGFTPGPYHIVSIESGKWRLDRSPAAVGTGGGVWSLGGALASPGKAGALHVGGNLIYLHSGTYTISSATPNVSGGRLTLAAAAAGTWTRLEGNPASRPVLKPASDLSAYLVTYQTYNAIQHITFDGNQYALANTRALTSASEKYRLLLNNCEFREWAANYPVACGHNFGHVTNCLFNHCNGTLSDPGGSVRHCVFNNCAWANSAAQITASVLNPLEIDECIFNGSQRALRLYTNSSIAIRKCIFYGFSGGSGSGNVAFFQTGNGAVIDFDSCIFENVTGTCIQGHAGALLRIMNCAHYNVGAFNDGVFTEETGTIAGTQSFFVDPANGDFNLNNVAGGGALLRAATKVLAA